MDGVQVSGDGAVLDGLSLTVPIDIAAKNVTIRNSRILSTGDSWGIALRHAVNPTIANTEIYSPASSGPDRLMVGIRT